jgi:hypothetical protein
MKIRRFQSLFSDPKINSKNGQIQTNLKITVRTATAESNTNSENWCFRILSFLEYFLKLTSSANSLDSNLVKNLVY